MFVRDVPNEQYKKKKPMKVALYVDKEDGAHLGPAAPAHWPLEFHKSLFRAPSDNSDNDLFWLVEKQAPVKALDDDSVVLKKWFLVCIYLKIVFKTKIIFSKVASFWCSSRKTSQLSASVSTRMA